MIKNLDNDMYKLNAEITTSSFFDSSIFGKTIIIFFTKSFTVVTSLCISNTFFDN